VNKTVLIVDDSRVARMSLKKTLLAHAVEIVEASSAEEAFDYLEAAQSYPDLIFMDVMMAGMDGLTATKKLKAMPDLNAIPVVVCTGNQGELDHENALASGAVAVLTKPPVIEAVNNIMMRLTPQMDTAPNAQLPTQAVEEKVDKAMLTENVVDSIEQKLLPKMTQQAQQIVIEVGHQISTEIIEKQLAGKVQAEIDGLLPMIQNQISDAVKQDAMSAVQPLIAKQISEALDLNAEQTIQALLNDIDLSDQAAKALAIEASAWLTTQESQLQVALDMQIGPKVISAVDQHLDASLAAMIAPLVTLQIDKQLAAQGLDKSREQLAQLSKRVAQLNKVVMGLALSVVILAVFALL